MKPNIVADKSKLFALRIIKLHYFLREEKKEYVMSRQILKSGTSIGANIRESKNAQSNLDFINKLSIICNFYCLLLVYYTTKVR